VTDASEAIRLALDSAADHLQRVAAVASCTTPSVIFLLAVSTRRYPASCRAATSPASRSPAVAVTGHKGGQNAHYPAAGGDALARAKPTLCLRRVTAGASAVILQRRCDTPPGAKNADSADRSAPLQYKRRLGDPKQFNPLRRIATSRRSHLRTSGKWMQVSACR
jgi:hypothetical protein